MRIAFIIYNGLTTLDFIGAYDSLIRLKSMGFMPDLLWEICSVSREVRDINGLRILPTKVGGSLHEYDLVYVPGGFSVGKLLDNTDFIGWLKTAEKCLYKVSVCTGSLLLGAAGFLQGKTATTHPSAYADLLKFCDSVTDQRIVDDDGVITARGVSASIDLGLYLCEKFSSKELMERIRKQMDYPYYKSPHSEK